MAGEDLKSIGDIKGVTQLGTPIASKLNDKTYYCKPCSLDEIPVLIENMSIVEKSLVGIGTSFGKPETIAAMKAIIKLGFKDIPESDIGSAFTLGDFPKIYQVVLDANDFLVGMKTIYAQ